MSTPISEFPDISWRPIVSDDVPALVEFGAAVHAVEDLGFVGGPEYWRWWLAQHGPDDTVLFLDAAGAIVGMGGSWVTDTAAGARAILWFDSHPDRLDLEPVLLDRVMQRGRDQIAASSHSKKMIRVSVEEHRNRRRALLESAGFRVARTFVDMERSLAGTLPEPRPAPEGIVVSPWSPDHDEAARLVSNAAFKDHWGSLPIDEEAWVSMILDEEVIRRDLSFVAIADGEMVAICLAEVDAEDDPDSLYVSRVGTHPAWQRRGLASLLLTRSLHAGAPTPLLKSTLAVDEESQFDATAVYARLGYRVTTRTVNYALEDPA